MTLDIYKFTYSGWSHQQLVSKKERIFTIEAYKPVSSICYCRKKVLMLFVPSPCKQKIDFIQYKIHPEAFRLRGESWPDWLSWARTPPGLQAAEILQIRTRINSTDAQDLQTLQRKCKDHMTAFDTVDIDQEWWLCVRCSRSRFSLV